LGRRIRKPFALASAAEILAAANPCGFAAISRADGALMAIAGAHVAWYGWYESRARSGDLAGDPLIDAATVVQG
jgi:hypothetical protein